LKEKGTLTNSKKANLEESALKNVIDQAWREGIAVSAETVGHFMDLLDSGKLRVAFQMEEGWGVHEWVKRGILLCFRESKAELMQSSWGAAYDKIPLKFKDWSEKDFTHAGIRAVPGALVRKGVFLGSSTVIMPSFINIGAYVGSRTMIDTMARVGSCAQVGEDCHISGGVGLGGVLEPIQGRPVIIEDNCFIGAQSQIVEGVLVGEGSVIGMNTFIGASTKIIHRQTGKTFQGAVPPYSVVVPGSYQVSEGINLNCAVILKQVTASTRRKVDVNELLRS
jgi:2,3,4,5-tetrahydropyridine-2-carboxylate N-succinyltransferase